ncbi:MAG: hypothetical protein ACYS9X_32000 [Planctomycetota bacterium]
MSKPKGLKTIVLDDITIAASSGDIESLETIIEASASAPTAAQKKSVDEIEISAHGASFHVGDAAHANKKTWQAYLPYNPGDITWEHCQNTFVRAVADAAISNVVVTLHLAKKFVSDAS